MESIDISSSWAVVRERVLKLTIQDLSIVLICASAVYLLRARDSYTLQPAWRMHIDTESAYENEKYPAWNERLVRPLVTDLENDEEAEVLVVTPEYQLQVLSVPAKPSLTQGLLLPYVTVKASAQLPESARGGAAQVVAMATGFIQVYNSSETAQRRTQVVVLVLRTLEVFCYSTELSLLWRTQLPVEFEVNKVKAITVLVTSFKQEENDMGSIYIGESFFKANSSSDWTAFRMHCLAGDSGTLRWSEQPHTMDRMRRKDEKQIDWTELSPYFFSQMPHHWSEPTHTRFTLLDLNSAAPPNPHALNSLPVLEHLQDIIGLEAHHIQGLPFGGMPAHNDHEHVANPDTLVLNNHQGIQLLDLKSGISLSHLPLQSSGAVYVEEGQRLVRIALEREHCQATADIMQPHIKTMFSSDICSSASSSVWIRAAFSAHRDLHEDPALALPPCVVPSVAKRGGVFNNLMGRTLRSEHKGHDNLFLTSSGRLTSLSPSGHVNWQVLVSANWAEFGVHRTMVGHGYTRTDQLDIYTQAFKPSMNPLSLKVYGKQNLLLVLGWHTASLVDLYDGYGLTEMALPCPPMDAPVISDFDADGVNDVIITCQFGYIGLRIEKQASIMHSLVTGIAVILTVLLLSWYCKPAYDEDEAKPYHHQRQD